MCNLPTPTPKVNPPTSTTTRPQLLPTDFVRLFQQWLRHKGLDPEQAHWWTVCVQRFRTFRRLPSSPKPFHEALVAFLEHQRTQFHAQPWETDRARKAILELAAWWRARQTTAVPIGPATSLVRPPAKEPLSAESAAILRRVRTELRFRHYSYRTEQTYLGWITWTANVRSRPASCGSCEPSTSSKRSTRTPTT